MNLLLAVNRIVFLGLFVYFSVKVLSSVQKLQVGKFSQGLYVLVSNARFSPQAQVVGTSITTVSSNEVMFPSVSVCATTGKEIFGRMGDDVASRYWANVTDLLHGVAYSYRHENKYIRV